MPFTDLAGSLPVHRQNLLGGVGLNSRDSSVHQLSRLARLCLNTSVFTGVAI